MNTSVKNVDDYLALQPAETRTKLEKMRQTIKAAAPGAEEVISYGMPAYKYQGILVYFAGYKNHIGFYPASSGIVAFEKEISAFENSKGTVRFPIEKPLPVGLITKIVKFRVKENQEKVRVKKKRKVM